MTVEGIVGQQKVLSAALHNIVFTKGILGQLWHIWKVDCG